MTERRYSFTQPRVALLRWLVAPGRDVSPRIGKVLLGELFASPKAIIAGILNGLILNVVALLMQDGMIFAVFIAADVLLVSARLLIIRRAIQAALRDLPTPTDLYLATAGAGVHYKERWLFSRCRLTHLHYSFCPRQQLWA